MHGMLHGGLLVAGGRIDERYWLEHAHDQYGRTCDASKSETERVKPSRGPAPPLTADLFVAGAKHLLGRRCSRDNIPCVDRLKKFSMDWVERGVVKLTYAFTSGDPTYDVVFSPVPGACTQAHVVNCCAG